MDTTAVIKSYYKAHNASAPAFKAQLAALRKVADRAVHDWEAAPIRGASPAAFVEARLAKFCEALRTSSVPEQDVDLLPAAHPALAAGDPWSALVSAEDRLASLAKSALSGITRTGLRKQSLHEVNEAHRRLVHLFDLNFATNSVAKSATGVCRADLVAATALVHEELERRGAVIAPQHALYKEALAVRSAATPKMQTGYIVHKADCSVLCLPGLGRLSITNRAVAADVDKASDMWSPDGSKYHTAFREPVEASYSVDLSKDDSGPAAHVFTYALGAVTPAFTEVFVHHTTMNGVLLVGPSSVTLRKQLQPYVLTEAAVAAAWMPPDGESALPQSLEQDVPPEFRYWKAADGEDPAEIRAQLVKSGLLGPGCVALVNGQPRRVVAKMFVAESYGPAPSQFAHAQLELSAADAVAELAKAEPLMISDGADLECIVDGALGTDDYLFGARTSPAVVKALSALGRPFHVNGDEEYVFVSARAVPGAEYVTGTGAPDQATSVRLLKNDTDQRYVLGVVLEPETVDAQNDIYSADEVMKSAHTFLAEFRNAGLQHQTLVNDKVRIVESYLAPADFELNGEPVKKGTWLIGMVVEDDAIWKAVKSGALTGFSIGGSAIRTDA